jgi:hypothetical protein
MAQRVRVERSLDYIGEADHSSNITGNPATKKIVSVWNFSDELVLDATNKYTIYIDGTSSVAAGKGGALLTTAATDTKTASISMGGLFWYVAKNPVCEFTFSLDVVTTVAINAGFNDAVSEGSHLLPCLITTATLTDTATDAAMFVYDTNQTLAYWNVANTNNGTQAFTQLTSTYVPVAATLATVRVKLDTSGNAYYWYNGKEVGYKALAVATTGTIGFVPYFGIKNETGTAHVATLRRVRAWCDV